MYVYIEKIKMLWVVIEYIRFFVFSTIIYNNYFHLKFLVIYHLYTMYTLNKKPIVCHIIVHSFYFINQNTLYLHNLNKL